MPRVCYLVISHAQMFSLMTSVCKCQIVCRCLFGQHPNIMVLFYYASGWKKPHKIIVIIGTCNQLLVSKLLPIVSVGILKYLWILRSLKFLKKFEILQKCAQYVNLPDINCWKFNNTATKKNVVRCSALNPFPATTLNFYLVIYMSSLFFVKFKKLIFRVK